ncbi:MAG: alpha-galactosidase [Lachnospiraceae bacterium]|nr:alpha-galactosidase [Lachnospiraceae bacterium]
MSIKYLENERLFKLDTPNTSYICGLADNENFLLHVYYGKRISDDDMRYLMRIYESPFTPQKNNRDRGSFLDAAPFEYPCEGIGDARSGCLVLETTGGYQAADLHYVNHRIYKGKPELKGMPATYGSENDSETLEITLKDALTGMVTMLCYSIFDGLDAITRTAKLCNSGKEPLYLRTALSMCLDLDNRDYDMITLHGSWARERHIDRVPVGFGKHEVSSVRGESSHQMHPFMAVAGRNTTQTEGEIYGFNFVYSGNFTASVERSQHNSIRCLMGINPKGFSWKLDAGEEFDTPEVIMVYSGNGIGHMSHTFHDLYREHLICGGCRSNKYKDMGRPILINNWEATYFDFDSDKLVAIAKEAAKSGIEMLVMDDGWFGNRSSDNMALGDWFVNEDKIKGGLKKLVDDVNAAGLKFGIWLEPEMISPDSDLYREHPDWAIAIPGRTATLMRNQYVLDLSRKEVVDEIYSRVKAVLRSANIEYVKWDMNRGLSDIGSYALESDRQGELFHRYVLGVYDMQQRLMNDFPDLLLENCSGGGARFDPGMLYYSPQIWCSDDTDAIERLSIQEGTALVYPLSSMGAHVSDCPNHTVGRVTPFETRGYVALAGTFGYELDITRIPEEDRAMIPEQTEMYHKYNELVRTGDYYRISSYSENNLNDCWEVVSKDRSRALVTYIKVLARPNSRSNVIRLRGLDPAAAYRVICDKRVLSLEYPSLQPTPEAPWGRFDQSKEEIRDEALKYSKQLVLHGDTLMNAGLCINENTYDMAGDFRGVLIELVRV